MPGRAEIECLYSCLAFKAIGPTVPLGGSRGLVVVMGEVRRSVRVPFTVDKRRQNTTHGLS